MKTNIDDLIKGIRGIFGIVNAIMGQMIVIGSYIFDAAMLSNMIASDSKNVLLFAGDHHTSSVVEFFQYILQANTIEASPRTAMTRCVRFNRLREVIDIDKMRETASISYR